MRVEHEYDRGGALAYLAAWDVHHARLFGRCEPTTGIEPFDRLVAQVMTTQPSASAARGLWVVDNGPSHRGQASVDRLQGGWSNLTLNPSAGPCLLAEPGGATRGRMRAVVRPEGGSTEVEGVVPGPVRKDRPRLGVRRGSVWGAT